MTTEGAVRPYVLLSCAMSVDGHIDDASPRRLVLSDEADLDRVDAERARSDAILVGANTVRRDDPRLLVRSEVRREQRAASGLARDPLKVTVTGRGDLDPSLRFFSTGEGEKVVYCATPAAAGLRARVGGLAAVVDAGDPLDLERVLADLARRGVRRLMVEGGSHVHGQLMAEGLADELQLVIAPLVVGDEAAPRFLGQAALRPGPDRRLALAGVRRIGDAVLLRYLLSPRAAEADLDRDRRWLRAAIELSRRCPPSETAYSVGALLVADDDRVIAEGYSRESDPRVHAEESALAKATGDPRLAAATCYSSLEPCTVRRSRPRSCTALLLASGVRRVVFALREPELFVDGRGAEELERAGVTVVELPELAGHVREVNGHLLAQRPAGKPADGPRAE